MKDQKNKKKVSHTRLKTVLIIVISILTGGFVIWHLLKIGILSSHVFQRPMDVRAASAYITNDFGHYTYAIPNSFIRCLPDYLSKSESLAEKQKNLNLYGDMCLYQELHVYEKNDQKRVANIKTVLRSYPDNEYFTKLLAIGYYNIYRDDNTLSNSGDVEEFATAAHKTAKFYPKDSFLAVNFGRRLHKLGKYQDAVTLYEHVLDEYGTDPYEGDTHQELCRAYAELGNREKVISDCTKALNYFEKEYDEELKNYNSDDPWIESLRSEIEELDQIVESNK